MGGPPTEGGCSPPAARPFRSSRGTTSGSEQALNASFCAAQVFAATPFFAVSHVIRGAGERARPQGINGPLRAA